MTVCIAAICRDDRERKIVVCTDNKISSAVGSSERGNKVHYLPEGWLCLVSGTEPEYLALVRLYRERFRDSNNLSAISIDSSIKWPLHRRKMELADEYTRTRFAMCYEDFIKCGKNQLPPEIFYESIQNIKNIELEADLILCGFIDGDAEIYHTDRKGSARATADFASVGEGKYLASSVLLRRQQFGHDSLEATLYNVFEAKKFSEAVGSVGETTFIAVISSDGRMRLTSLELDAQLAAAYRAYGPTDVPTNIKFEGNYYYEMKNKSNDAMLISDITQAVAD